MELLQLILFSLSYTFMSTGIFFDTILIYLFLKISYKSNNLTHINLYDPTTILIKFLIITLYLMVYQMDMMIDILKQNNYSNQVISVYNKLNVKYVELRNTMLYYVLFKPLKFGMKKAISNFKISIPKTNIDSNIKLNSNQSINDFLDGLLDNKNL